MTEVRPATIKDIREHFGDALPDGLGERDFLQTAEMLFALAADACDEVDNHASMAIATSDGRYLIVSAQYADGKPLTAMYAEIKHKCDELHEALHFARSVIKSGEPWTDMCESVIGNALALSDEEE